MSKNQRAIDGLLIDLDGVIYQSGDIIPGAPEPISWLASQKIPPFFL